MNSKNKILNALKKNIVSNQVDLPSKIKDHELFKDFPEDTDLLDVFASNFQALHGELYKVKNLEGASSQLSSIISGEENKKCISYSSEILNKLFSINSDLSDLFYDLSINNIDSEEFASFEIGLTTSDYLIARTGSIVLNSLTGGGRRISVLPPIHIVIAYANQIVDSLDNVFNNDFLSNDWSYATIISGPSRTSDIEKQLVLGAHGPKRLIVILIENI